MKSYKSLFLLLALMFSAFPAFAQNTANPCDNVAEATRNKSAVAVAVILDMCRKKPNITIGNAIGDSLPEAEQVSKWAAASKGFAEALGIAAKELGVAVNDFLNSPAGILLAFILLFNYAGGAMIGLPFTMFTLWLFYRVMRSMTIGEVTYENVPIFWGFTNIRRKIRVGTREWDGDATGTVFFTGIGLLILNLIVWLNL